MTDTKTSKKNQEEQNTIINEQPSQEITEAIKTNPLKHAVAPGKLSLGEAIEMGDKLKNTAPNQISIGLDKYEETLKKQRKVKID